MFRGHGVCGLTNIGVVSGLCIQAFCLSAKGWKVEGQEVVIEVDRRSNPDSWVASRVTAVRV